MYVDIRIQVDVEREEGSDENIFSITKVERRDTTVPKNAVLGLQETLSQSDFGSIDFPQAIIHALDGSSTTFQ